jgi:hypothetical protein
MNTLLNDLSTGFAVFLLLVCVLAVFCVVYVRRLSNYCRDAAGFVINQNKNAVSLRRMAEVEATLTELTDSYDSLLKSHKLLRSRIGMRNNREAKENPLDSTHDKTKLRLAAKQAGYLR